jgi:hypothetical protein
VRFHVAEPGGAPIGGAAVALLDDRGREVAAGAADGSGAGELRAPHPGSYVLVAGADGHQTCAVAVTVADGPASVAAVLARSASVSGTVLGEDGPIAGARVTLVQDGEIVDAVDSAADGSYRLDDVPPGEYGLSVAAAGCDPHAALLVLPDETDLRVDVDLEPALPQADEDGRLDGAGLGPDAGDVAELLLRGQQDHPGR